MARASQREPALEPEGLSETFHEKLVLVAMGGVLPAGLLVAARELPLGPTLVSTPVVPRADGEARPSRRAHRPNLVRVPLTAA